MRKNVIIGLIGLGTVACAGPADGYKITGNIEGAGNGKVILTKSAGWEETVAGDTVEMRMGKFVFEGKLNAPAQVALAICPENGTPANLGFIAENSEIQVEGNWKNVKDQYGYYRLIDSVQVSGSVNNAVYEKISGVYQQFLNAPEFKEYADLQKKLSELRQTDVEAYYKLQEESEELAEQFQKAVRERQLALIRENRSVESSVLYLRALWNDMTLDELKEIFQALDTNVQNGPMAAEAREEIAIRERVKPGQPAPDFNLETPDGSRLSLSDLRGKYVVLDFWASWCRPCRASFPEMKKIYARYKDKGLEILGITNDSQKQNWLKALEEDQLPWKQVIDEFPVKFKPAKVATLYAIPYLPTLILIDPDGKIIGQAKDKHQLAEWLEERLGEKK